MDGKRDGKGKEYFNDGNLKFKGEYFDGKKEGKGKEYYLGKKIYEGDYSNDKRI